MQYLIGIVLALVVFLFARLVRLDRDRAFYPTVLIVVASYYGLFAIVGGSLVTLALESIAIVGFIALSVAGFKFSLWLVAAALFAHGIYDFFHGHLIANTGMPAWWPGFCMAYDVTASVCLAWLLRPAKTAATENQSL
ncbi:MAG: hypothetical protein HYV95_17200 [Opitutae bacterium]|nr:hypothetical protein [Opitutae bacterium]